MLTRFAVRNVLAGTTGTLLLLLVCATAKSQAPQVTVSDSDYYAVSQAKNGVHHAWRANSEAGREARSSELSNLQSASPAAAAAAPDSGGPRYPADLEYLGGAVVVSMESHAIYLFAKGGTCTTVAGCWGNPQGFLRDYGKSDMIHITDQYVGSTANNRYTVAEEATNVKYTPPAKPFTDADMLALVHAVVVSGAGVDDNDGDVDYLFSSGYGNEYHIFLPPGQDECFDATYTVCYSPDIPKSFIFCAYHGSADFSDIGHVLYSVEPFQAVNGCNVRAGTPNGLLVDSTNNVLSHELTETITDPDGTAWINIFLNALFGAEIGDECSFLQLNASLVPIAFDPSNVTLNGNKYAIQPEENNAAHACTTAP